jgi:hypothetical protein
MSELTIKIGPNDTIELTAVAKLTPMDAATLARTLFAVAALSSVQQAPPIGTIMTGTDAHHPILKWVVTKNTHNGRPTIVFSIPPGIDVTFQITPQNEKELGEALVAHADGLEPPPMPRGPTLQ